MLNAVVEMTKQAMTAISMSRASREGRQTLAAFDNADTNVEMLLFLVSPPAILLLACVRYRNPCALVQAT
jgi:hypothetical protein